MNDLESFFAQSAQAVDAHIRKVIEAADIDSDRLREAINWSLFGGGKRFRPAVVFAVGDAVGVERRKLLAAAAAVEMVHTYSLIHDDLPAMDDDDLRRGRETCHKKFDEATAILAGDALHVLAFEAVAADAGLSADVKLRLISGLADAAKKMVIGQQLDLDGEGRKLSIEAIRKIHSNKTGALIAFSASIPALIGETSDDEKAAILRYGDGLGLLFQISDDILDVTEPTETLGKTASRDIDLRKATYPGTIGIEQARLLSHELFESTLAALRSVERPTQILAEIARYVVNRKY